MTLREINQKYTFLQEESDRYFQMLSIVYEELQEHKDIFFTLCAYALEIYRFTDEELREIILAILKENKKIIFFLSSEAIIKAVIEKIHNAIENTDIDSKNIFLTTGTLDGSESYEQLCSVLNYKKRINIISYYVFERIGRGHQYIITKNDSYHIKKREKKFLCFNKIERLHRMELLAHIIDRNLLNKSFYSFEGRGPNIEWLGQWLDNYSSIPEHDKKIFNTVKENQNIFPLRLDGGVSESRPNPVEISQKDLEYFENSYFSVVTETIFYEPHEYKFMTLSDDYKSYRFFTEKTYKPIAVKHPFILVGSAFMLARLRDRGYKTFHPFINEKYDKIIDGKKRLITIVDEIERLCNMTEDEWHEWQLNIKDIVEHNYNRFFEITDFRHTKWEMYK